jgi:phospholipid transport system substrate-binding protein
MSLTKTFSTALLAAALGLGGTAWAAPDPVEVIREQDKELQALLRDPDVGEQTGRVKELINGIFDFGELGRRALGPTHWRRMTDAQQERFVNAFRTMVENSSVKRLEAYSSDSTRYLPPEIDDDRATVTAHVFSKGVESIAVYRLQLRNGEWRAWDLILDDLSTARNYGDQFRRILQDNDYEELIRRLENRARDDAGTTAQPVATDNIKAKSERTGAGAATP